MQKNQRIMKQLAPVLFLFALACSDGEPASMDASVLPGPALPGAKRIFATSNKYDGNMVFSTGRTGLDGADRLCTAAAQAATLGGTWLALLSEESLAGDALARIEDVGPWYLVGTETVVFDRRADLAGDSLVPIDRDELGRETTGELDEFFAWKGRFDGSTIEMDCVDWTSNSDREEGYVGLVSDTGSVWTYTFSCDMLARIYCIEQ